jgi:aspartyl-tRNA(Asn)/glutamyl-tRNA(Gln) amidotransferase subunit C
MMSDLNKESIRTLSHLCRIEVTEPEIEPLLQVLQRVLDYVGQLQEVDVTHLSVHSHVDEQGVDFLRPDSVEDHLPREHFLANAPDQISGMIRVPPVMRQNP